ncbi:MAG: hypothetical protein IPL28_25990 [Chloroflexi bacterium]|nr:hypothetical protein [Chloroflexota bacterium]MDA0242438.1 hypothetical protein [Chloroflexota bacterium]
MEKIGYTLLGIATLGWFGLILWGLVAAFPAGLIGLIAIVGVGFLSIKVIGDRLDNKEDDHYHKTVQK